MPNQFGTVANLNNCDYFCGNGDEFFHLNLEQHRKLKGEQYQRLVDGVSEVAVIRFVFIL